MFDFEHNMIRLSAVASVSKVKMTEGVYYFDVSLIGGKEFRACRRQEQAILQLRKQLLKEIEEA